VTASAGRGRRAAARAGVAKLHSAADDVEVVGTAADLDGLLATSSSPSSTSW
jgi:hypothetical protein